MNKVNIVKDIIRSYEHDSGAEGDNISKRRLWYILKPKFLSADLAGIIHKGVQVKPISNADYNKYYNELAELGEIDDTYISDNSRTTLIGELLPHIVIAAEKATVATTAMNLAEKFGCSCYIAGGFSSIYAAKGMMEEIDEDIVVLVMSDYDKSGLEIVDTIANHFDGCEIHRALITPEQVPANKIEEYFKDNDPVVGKAYELDVLNIHELEEVFLQSIPNHIEQVIVDAYTDDQIYKITEECVWEAVADNDEVAALQNQLETLQSELYYKYKPAFLEAEPITFRPFNSTDIYDETVEYSVADWKVAV